MKVSINKEFINTDKKILHELVRELYPNSYKNIYFQI